MIFGPWQNVCKVSPPRYFRAMEKFGQKSHHKTLWTVRSLMGTPYKRQIFPGEKNWSKIRERNGLSRGVYLDITPTKNHQRQENRCRGQQSVNRHYPTQRKIIKSLACKKAWIVCLFLRLLSGGTFPDLLGGGGICLTFCGAPRFAKLHA